MTQEQHTKYADEIGRINRMTVEDIINMKPVNLWKLTDCFCEPLVRFILAKFQTLDMQVKLVEDLIKKYKSAYEEIVGSGKSSIPIYLTDLEYDIESKLLITEDGSKPAPQHACLIITPMTGSADISSTQDDKDKLIAELRIELEQMKQHVKELQDSKLDSITQEEFDEIFSDWDDNSQTKGNSQLTSQPSTDIVENLQQQLKEANKRIEELQEQLKEKISKEQWIDWLDGDVFLPKINAEEIYKSLCNAPTPHLRERARCYVLFRVLDLIKCLKKNVNKKDILKWWNAHFNCGWQNDSQFKFTDLPENIKVKDITQWKKCQGNNNEYYYEFAQTLITTFAYPLGSGKYEIKKQFFK